MEQFNTFKDSNAMFTYMCDPFFFLWKDHFLWLFIELYVDFWSPAVHAVLDFAFCKHHYNFNGKNCLLWGFHPVIFWKGAKTLCMMPTQPHWCIPESQGLLCHLYTYLAKLAFPCDWLLFISTISCCHAKRVEGESQPCSMGSWSRVLEEQWWQGWRLWGWQRAVGSRELMGSSFFL